MHNSLQGLLIAFNSFVHFYNLVMWLLLTVTSSGSMEFVVPAADPSAFFPIDVKFTSNKIFCDLKVCSHPQFLRSTSQQSKGSWLLMSENVFSSD